MSNGTGVRPVSAFLLYINGIHCRLWNDRHLLSAIRGKKIWMALT